MKPYESVAIVTILLATLTQSAIAEEAGEQAARGAGYAMVVAEKCRGVPESVESAAFKQKRLFMALQNAGFAFEDIKRGYLIGALSAESRYPRKTKPSHKECSEASMVVESVQKL